MADSEMLELMGQAIDIVWKKSADEVADNSIKIKMANVIVYDNETYMATVTLLGDESKNEYNILNKSGEALIEGDTVKIYYTTNVAKGWIGVKCGTPATVEKIVPYISAKVTNQQNVKYDAIDRNILSVDFNVDDNKSDVIFSANQICDVTKSGELTTYYKVDGMTQEYKPIESLDDGRRVITHIYPMTLSVGKHNFSVYLLSENGGRGSIKIGGLLGALSGQISGLRDLAPPNNNLLLYINDVPAGTLIGLPQLMINGSTKIVDWGDGTDPEESKDSDVVSHTYESSGNYIITIKCNNTSFQFNGTGASSDSSIKPYITAVYFPDNALYIHWGYLSNCPKLKTVYLGSSATDIDLGLTGNNGGLTSLILPETSETIVLTGLGSTSVASLVIPPKVTSLRSLESITSLTSVEFQNSVLSSCRSDTNLVRVKMSDKITIIPELMFSYCSLLNDITFSQNITQIGQYAFDNCKSLTRLPLLPYLTSIGTCAFRECTSLQSVKLGSNLKYIGTTNIAGATNDGDSTFYNCTALTDIHIPSNVLTIGYRAFYNVPAQFTKEDFPKSLAKVCSEAFCHSGTVSAVIKGGTIYGEYIFKNCYGLTDVEIQDGITYIPKGMFYNCTNLNTVEFPNSLVSIEESAFYNTGLTEFGNGIISSNLLRIGTSAFANCNFLTKVVIPSSVETVGIYAFKTCANLETVVFEVDGAQQITQESFSDCIKLTNLDLGDVVNIGTSSFQGCISLTEIAFNSGTILGGYAFRGCTGLTQLSLLDSLAILSDGSTTTYGGKYNIGDCAFIYCTNLNNVDGYTYKWNVGVKVTESTKDSDGNWVDVETDLGIKVYGIYNAMGATEDRVFLNTGLKDGNSFLVEHPEYANVSSSDYKKTYSVYIDKTPI